MFIALKVPVQTGVILLKVIMCKCALNIRLYSPLGLDMRGRFLLRSVSEHEKLEWDRSERTEPRRRTTEFYLRSVSFCFRNWY
jgi:hypothetical protein